MKWYFWIKQVEPLFGQMSRGIEDQTSGGLLLTNLRCHDESSQLILDSRSVPPKGREMENWRQHRTRFHSVKVAPFLGKSLLPKCMRLSIRLVKTEWFLECFCLSQEIWGLNIVSRNWYICPPIWVNFKKQNKRVCIHQRNSKSRVYKIIHLLIQHKYSSLKLLLF